MLTCHTDRTRIKLSEEKALGLNECFLNFTNPETLKDKNEWYCNKCKKFVKATKQMEVYKTNRILVIAFKRFSRFTKVKTAINFPL
jgi:ubiquitin C-terminal hydrolase